MVIREAVQKYKKSYKNFLNVMWNIWRGKKEIKIVLQNGDTQIVKKDVADGYATLIQENHLSSKIEIYKGHLRYSFIYNGRSLEWEGYTGVGEVFISEDYSFLEVKNEIIIDVGANVADSPIYFVLKNAKKVIALELNPNLYNMGIKNVKENGFEDRITLLNAGYGKDGTVKLDYDLFTTQFDLKSTTSSGFDVNLYSLKTLLNDYKIDHAILKMDCEGCEYNLIQEDINTLRKFKMIQIEYHYGYEKLKEKLEDAGFTVTYSKPVKSSNKYATEQNMVVGYIYAKIDS